MMAGGTFVYLLQAKQGHNIESLFSKPFKGRYAQGLTACLYIVLFFSAQSQLANRLQIIDVNTKIDKSPVQNLWLQVIQ